MVAAEDRDLARAITKSSSTTEIWKTTSSKLGEVNRTPWRSSWSEKKKQELQHELSQHLATQDEPSVSVARRPSQNAPGVGCATPLSVRGAPSEATSCETGRPTRLSVSAAAKSVLRTARAGLPSWCPGSGAALEKAGASAVPGVSLAEPLLLPSEDAPAAATAPAGAGVERESSSGSNTARGWTWMFLFDVPSRVTEQAQQEFSRSLAARMDNPTLLVANAFRAFVDADSVHNAMKSQRSHSLAQQLVERTQKNFSLPTVGTISKTGATAEEELQDSYRRALQCTIELFLAFFEEGIQAASRGALGPGQPQVLDSVHFLSQDGQHMCLCVRMSRDFAELRADVGEYPVQLAREALPNIGIVISDPKTSPAYVKFDKVMRDLCAHYPDPYEDGETSVLRDADRIRILYDMLTDYFELSILEQAGLVGGSFPLHHEATLKGLQRTWGSFRLLLCLEQPMEEVRQYFGEEIATYFSFLQELVKATVVLAVPALLGMCFDAARLWVRPCLGVAILVWYRCFLVHWHHLEAKMNNLWGLEAHNVTTIKQPKNPRFVGKLRPSPENEALLEPSVPPSTKRYGRFLSFFLTALFMFALVIAVSVEHWGFFELSRTVPAKVKSPLSAAFGGFIGVQIKVVDRIWDAISTRIVDLECRPMEMDFHRSKRRKATAVRFVTSTSSLIFLAFVQPVLTEVSCHIFTQHCMQQDREMLARQLLTIFVSRYIILAGTMKDVVKPFFAYHWKTYWRHQGSEVHFTEKQVDMLTYTVSDLTDDWLDVLVPLGFVLLFGMVAPSALLLFLVAILFQVRSDAWKLTKVYRRPYPYLAIGIEGFTSMLNFYGYCAICSNLALVLYDFGGVVQFLPFSTDSLLQRLEPEDRWRFRCMLELITFISLAFLAAVLWRAWGDAATGVGQALRLERRRQALQRHYLGNAIVQASIQVGGDSSVGAALQIPKMRLRQKANGSGRRRDFGVAPKCDAADSV